MENELTTPGSRLKSFIEDDLKMTLNEVAPYIGLASKTVYNLTDGPTKLSVAKLKPFTDIWPLNPQWIMQGTEPRLLSPITDKNLQTLTTCEKCKEKDALIAELKNIIEHYKHIISLKPDKLNNVNKTNEG